MNNIRRPSTEAAGHGGGTSAPAANSTNVAPRRRGASRRATTHREDQSLLRSFRLRGQPLGQTMCGRGGHLAKLNYMDIKNMLDRQQALRKKGILSDGEIKSLVKEWHDVRTEAELNSAHCACTAARQSNTKQLRYKKLYKSSSPRPSNCSEIHTICRLIRLNISTEGKAKYNTKLRQTLLCHTSKVASNKQSGNSSRKNISTVLISMIRLMLQPLCFRQSY